ncbi:MAG: anthranilate synthase component I [Candidatus Omnitrophica bacterium]|nr:anthranilate synthase component I [Candidatus Omnitrophota bacterium]
MIYPSKKEFVNLAKKGNLIPVYKDILADFDTPLSSFLKIDAGGYSYLLESVEGGERLARYSFLGSNPSLIFKSKGRTVEVRENGVTKKWITDEDPITEIKKIMKRFAWVDVKGLPRFSGGLVGYIGYDMVRFFERLPDKNPDDLNVPDACLVLTDAILIFDHVERIIKIVSNAHVRGNAAAAYDASVRQIRLIEGKLKKNMPVGRKHTARAMPAVRSNVAKDDFKAMVTKAKDYIYKGDIIQTVLSQRLEVPITAAPFDVYRALRSINPSPYMFYLNFGDLKLVGSSPEIMVRTEGNVVEVRPIAGTRPRGRDNAEDVRLIRGLLKDPKEKAEHIMLVDLGRNDIGRIARFNTVKTTNLMEIEKYSHVIHIVSDVTGVLRRDKDIYDVIRATFPAGTVSGAPKIRAMEIIDELENVKRGVYAGAVGYFSFSGNQDLCIAIRTIVIKGRTAYVQVGAGLVKDSRPEKEYQETMNKARALLKAIEAAERGLE